MDRAHIRTPLQLYAECVRAKIAPEKTGGESSHACARTTPRADGCQFRPAVRRRHHKKKKSDEQIIGNVAAAAAFLALSVMNMNTPAGWARLLTCCRGGARGGPLYEQQPGQPPRCTSAIIIISPVRPLCAPWMRVISYISSRSNSSSSSRPAAAGCRIDRHRWLS